MRWLTKTQLAAAALLATAAMTEGATAQVNCNALPHGAARANCYGREAQIYRQQSQDYGNIAQQQYRQHQQIGRALRRTAHRPLRRAGLERTSLFQQLQELRLAPDSNASTCQGGEYGPLGKPLRYAGANYDLAINALISNIISRPPFWCLTSHPREVG